MYLAEFFLLIDKEKLSKIKEILKKWRAKSILIIKKSRGTHFLSFSTNDNKKAFLLKSIIQGYGVKILSWKVRKI